MGNPLLFFTVLPFRDALQSGCPFVSVSIIHCNEFSVLFISFSGIILFALIADILDIPFTPSCKY